MVRYTCNPSSHVLPQSSNRCLIILWAILLIFFSKRNNKAHSRFENLLRNIWTIYCYQRYLSQDTANFELFHKACRFFCGKNSTIQKSTSKKIAGIIVNDERESFTTRLCTPLQFIQIVLKFQFLVENPFLSFFGTKTFDESLHVFLQRWKGTNYWLSWAVVPWHSKYWYDLTDLFVIKPSLPWR